ncbi:hypothetical protein RAS1_11440 [Phycisphaerae bacterium RAS1]|nr:hypothetical protein RAS1_11440 [Phycisphaerae bacterium RAS1]
MKYWPLFVATTVLCWGAYVPTIHAGQLAFNGKNKAMWAFLFVGVAYFLVAVLAPLVFLMLAREPSQLGNGRAVGVSTLAGVLGAVGALGVVLALRSGGSPLTVPPLVFAGAPIVSTLIAMIIHRPEKAPDWQFFAGILLAAAGASLVLRHKP